MRRPLAAAVVGLVGACGGAATGPQPGAPRTAPSAAPPHPTAGAPPPGTAVPSATASAPAPSASASASRSSAPAASSAPRTTLLDTVAPRAVGCKTAADCRLVSTKCCACGAIPEADVRAVRGDWNPFCSAGIACPACASWTPGHQAACVKQVCRVERVEGAACADGELGCELGR